ncbi:MAG: hypothetical protein WDN66_05355 [Candidatus Saccharibacteria bacterium]
MTRVVEEFDALIADTPVDNDMLFEVTGRMETTGNRLYGSGALPGTIYAETLHSAFSHIANLDVQPPLSVDQQQLCEWEDWYLCSYA